MREFKNLSLFLLAYGGVLLLLPMLEKAKQATSNFALEITLFIVIYALWFYVIVIPLAFVSELWPKIKRRLFEKWKEEFEDEKK